MTTNRGRERARELGNLIPLLGAQVARVEAAETRTYQATLSPSGEFRVHAAGCRDLHDPRHAQHDRPIPLAATTAREIAAELNSDLIDEGSMTADEALDYVRFLPCTGLHA